MIIIHWDFTDGTEVSYVEGQELTEFTTNCLTFFSCDDVDRVGDVIVIKENGDYISARELLAGDSFYTNKVIRRAHNIYRLLVGEVFEWKTELYDNSF